MKTKLAFIILGILSLTGLPVRLNAQSYNVVILSGSDSYALGINNSGQVVGEAAPLTQGVYHAALFTGTGASGFTDLGTLGGSTSAATGINDAGIIVGYAGTGSNNKATIFSGTGSGNTNLGALGGTGGSNGFAINDSGLIVGSASAVGGYVPAAIFSGTGNTNLGTLGGSSGSAYAINNSGVIVGTSNITGDASTHATLFSGTGTGNTDLGTLGGANSYAYGINSSGIIVGAASTASGTLHATLFSGTGNVDLGTLGGNSSSAISINASGQIVGNSLTSSGSTHGFIDVSGSMTDLNTLVSGSTGVSGIYVGHGNVINDWGQIAATGVAGIQGRALLLNPVNAITTVTAGVQDVKLVAGMNYAKVAAYANTTGDLTGVSFLDGTAAKNRDVQVSFLSSTAGLASDIAQLTITTPDGTTQQDKFVLSLSYTGTPVNPYLAYFNTTTGTWVNAVLGNSDGGASANFVNGAYDPDTDFLLGDYGIDTATGTAWAVVDHNSEFAVVPEPSTWALFAAGTGLLMVFRRKARP